MVKKDEAGGRDRKSLSRFDITCTHDLDRLFEGKTGNTQSQAYRGIGFEEMSLLSTLLGGNIHCCRRSVERVAETNAVGPHSLSHFIKPHQK
jgi:hypothetical protein